MLKIEGRTFMNIQEAVQWLLDNNCVPFQCTADYAPLTEIGLGTIVNPTPAKVRIGSIIFFADSKVSTVVGITETGFICSDKYNNLVDDVAYVTNVAISASGHLITTFSDGQTQDAGLIKQVSSFSINASQHLIATYNDGTTSDLGAIFSGNISISGNLAVSGNIDGYTLMEKIKDASGNLRFVGGEGTPLSQAGYTNAYCGWSLSGTHIMFVLAGGFASGTTISAGQFAVFDIPQWIADKIFPVFGASNIEVKEVPLYNADWTVDDNKPPLVLQKSGHYVFIKNVSTSFTLAKDRSFRVQFDLLIDNN